MSTDDALGDRMKEYERQETAQKFIPGLPVYARIDGRGFSKFTKGLEMPFDEDFRRLMIEVTKFLVDKTGAKMGYTQSDEISLFFYEENPASDIFFAGKKQKMVSQLASLATARFSRGLFESQNPLLREKANLDPTFDARVCVLPNKQELVNMFLWREQDATKNALRTACQVLYSHKELLGKKGPDQHEMLLQKGVNFNDYKDIFKRGAYVQKKTILRPMTDEEYQKIPEASRPNRNTEITRNIIDVLPLPPLAKVINRVAVFFDQEAPLKENDLKPPHRSLGVK